MVAPNPEDAGDLADSCRRREDTSLFNEIGVVTGETGIDVPEGTFIVYVQAGGPWALRFAKEPMPATSGGPSEVQPPFCVPRR